MTSKTHSALFDPYSSPLHPHVFVRAVLRLAAANARRRERRRLEDLPDRLREDAGLPPRPDFDRRMFELSLRAGLLR